MLPTLFRQSPLPPYKRERIRTPDEDFLDLDWLSQARPHLAVLSHGLEGSSNSIYVRAMSTYLFQHGFDILAWNFRGCSGEPNLLPHSYHSGKSEDLRFVLEHVIEKGLYQSISLIGFSIGGNITLKYLGEEGDKVNKLISCAIGISVPCDLESSAYAIARPINIIYMQRFLLYLRRKIRYKAQAFPEIVSTDGLKGAHTFHEFDERYTAPLNGYSSAAEYWRRCSSLPFLSNISIPTLLMSALDDSFLGESCYPFDSARDHEFFHFMPSQKGGHVGYILNGLHRPFWSELQTLLFLEKNTRCFEGDNPVVTKA